MEYYPAIKRNEIPAFLATWVDPEMVLLSEARQTEKDKHHTKSLLGGF